MKKELYIFKTGRLVAIQDVTTWTEKEIIKFVKIQRDMLGRVSKLRRVE